MKNGGASHKAICETRGLKTDRMLSFSSSAFSASYLPGLIFNKSFTFEMKVRMAFKWCAYGNNVQSSLEVNMLHYSIV